MISHVLETRDIETRDINTGYDMTLLRIIKIWKQRVDVVVLDNGWTWWSDFFFPIWIILWFHVIKPNGRNSLKPWKRLGTIASDQNCWVIYLKKSWWKRRFSCCVLLLFYYYSKCSLCHCSMLLSSFASLYILFILHPVCDAFLIPF